MHSNGMIVDCIHYSVETKNQPEQIACDNIHCFLIFFSML